MSAPGFYDDRDASKLLIDQHQALMWEVGDLMGQWEALQEHAAAERRPPSGDRRAASRDPNRKPARRQPPKSS